ncbi:MAG: hypothetical protein QXU18_12755 [Thermoplasmatales archaeon]
MISDTFAAGNHSIVFIYAMTSIVLTERDAFGSASLISGSTILMQRGQYLLSILYFVTVGIIMGISSMIRDLAVYDSLNLD